MESTSSPALSTSTPTEQESDTDTAICMQELSFPALNTALNRHIAVIGGSRSSQKERWWLVVGILGGGLGMLLGATLPGNAAGVAALIGLAIELFGLGIFMKRDLNQLWNARSEHASLLERSYINYQNLIKQIRSFPLDQRLKRQRYIENNLSNMQYRFNLFAGGISRLGILPILIALYLQLKNLRLDDWNIFANITLLQGMAAFIILVAYALAWILIHLQARVQACAQLLAEANAQDAG